MKTLHFISHTHWDREWYEPFQIYRLWLRQTVDQLLDILRTDPNYRHFMLDGQTVVLEDYMEIEPAREQELRGHIQSGRVLVGPWYVLPDEFLVSGEAIIRNLQRGMRIANEWGKSMMVGYIPDPFGHISQMPQILKGFGIDIAMFRRGLADEPTELWWEASDGTRILTTYLRDGYDNAAWLPRDPQGFVYTVNLLVQSLAPYATTPHMLMMHGTDHMRPWEGLPALLRLTETQLLDTRAVHSTLPEYADAVRQALSPEEMQKLPVVCGELRNPKRHHLLPGVVSTRTWIKQRNMRAEDLIERWAEPLAAVAMELTTDDASRITEDASRITEDVSPVTGDLQPATGDLPPVSGDLQPASLDLRPELDLAWKYLLQNQPHDSICGCSVDQVHDEMRSRFDWVEQIGGDVVQRAEAVIVPAISTHQEGIEKGVAIVVFNPAPEQKSQAATVQVDLPNDIDGFQIVDENGDVLPYVELRRRVVEYSRVTATPEQLRWTFGAAQSGSVEGHQLRDFAWRIDGENVYADLTVSNQGAQDMALVQRGLEQLGHLLANPALKLYQLVIHSLRQVDLLFQARDLPGNGYKTFWLVPAVDTALAENKRSEQAIDNEFLRVEANAVDGTLTITDRATGTVFAGANRFVDGGDRGDLYNYCAPENDTLVAALAEPPRITRRVDGEVRQELEIKSVLRVPAQLAPDRANRSTETVDILITTIVSLSCGARRVEFHTRAENTARDHRLQVEFPTPIQTTYSLGDQAFDLVKRDIRLPTETQGWVEQPVPTLPLQKYVMVQDAENGAALATRGVMEYEVKAVDRETRRQGDKETRGQGDKENGNGGVTMALTLLRCIEWLSRPDLANRNGNAGPEKLTPGAQELGTHEFDYAFIPYSTSYVRGLEGGLDESDEPLTAQGARAEALGFAVRAQAVATDLHTGVLPSAGSWVAVSQPNFLLTAIKPPYKGEGLVVRGYNAGDATIPVRLRPFRSFARAILVNLNEDALEELTWNGAGEIELQVRPREIVTVWFQD